MTTYSYTVEMDEEEYSVFRTALNSYIDERISKMADGEKSPSYARNIEIAIQLMNIKPSNMSQASQYIPPSGDNA